MILPTLLPKLHGSFRYFRCKVHNRLQAAPHVIRFVHIASDGCNDWIDDYQRNTADAFDSLAKPFHIDCGIEWTAKPLSSTVPVMIPQRF